MIRERGLRVPATNDVNLSIDHHRRVTAPRRRQRCRVAPHVSADVVNQHFCARDIGHRLEPADDINALSDRDRGRRVQSFARQSRLVTPFIAVEAFHLQHGRTACAGSANRVNRVPGTDDRMRRAGVEHRRRAMP